MLSRRYEFDGRPAVEMNRLQTSMKKAVDKKVKDKIYRFENVPCCICNCKEFEILSEKERYGLYMPVVICKKCGLIQTNPRMTPASYYAFYNQEYRKLYRGVELPSSSFFNEQYKKGENLYLYFQNNGLINKDLRDLFIYEVGCGMGGILQYFREKGCRVFGSDIGEEYLNYGRQKYGLDLTHGSIFDIKLNNSPDIIIYSHVLEHLLAPNKELMQLRRLFSPTGIIYIEVPGVKNLYNDYVMDFLLLLQNAHTYHFTLTTLKNLLQVCGFDFICGDEIIRSTWKISAEIDQKAVFRNDYQDVMFYLKDLEERRYFRRPFKKFLIKIIAIIKEILKKIRMYNFVRKVYKKMKKLVKG